MENTTASISAISDLLCRPFVECAARRFCDVLHAPQHLFEMLFYVEDKRFLIHFGIDPIAIARALVFDLRGAALQGGSTICQQLYNIERKGDSSQPSPPTITYKLKQSVWAVRQQLTTSKVRLLDRYISSVYWGRSYYGLDRAAYGYFGTSRSSLNVAQSFFLAERIASPNGVSRARVSNLLNRGVITARLVHYGASTSEVAELYAAVFG